MPATDQPQEPETLTLAAQTVGVKAATRDSALARRAIAALERSPRWTLTALVAALAPDSRCRTHVYRRLRAMAAAGRLEIRKSDRVNWVMLPGQGDPLARMRKITVPVRVMPSAQGAALLDFNPANIIAPKETTDATLTYYLPL